MKYHDKDGIDAARSDVRRHQLHHLALPQVDVHVRRRRQL